MIGSQSKQGFIKDKLYKKLKSFADASSGFPSASGTKSMYFDSSQDGPATIDVLNFVVRLMIVCFDKPIIFVTAVIHL